MKTITVIILLTQALILHQFAQVNGSFQTVEESSQLSNSKDKLWWLNSGAYFYYYDNLGHTVQGDLATGSKWQSAYAQSNPIDTDQGLHPQNLFRLLRLQKLDNSNEQVYFYIQNLNLSDSPNRNASNGVLLLNRYLDGQNLYYAGLRVDGAVVIKKKYQGAYTTLAYKQIFEGNYHKSNNPNLIPQKQWIGLKTEVINLDAQTVQIKLYLDQGTGWALVLIVNDNPTDFISLPLLAPGYGGVRTDFMDVKFKDFHYKSL